jgi:hypothetical protein
MTAPQLPTLQVVAAVLGHYGAHHRHFAHLMARRLRVIASQLAPAPCAVRRLEFNEVVYFFCWPQPSSAALMARLAALLPALRLALRLALIRGRIGRRRARGVRAVLPKALSQLIDLDLQIIDSRDLLAQTGELLLVSREADAHQTHLLMQ